MVAPTTAIPLPVEQISRLCPKFGVQELSVFGSVLEPARFGSTSDVDFLVTFKADDYGPWMSKLQGLERELAAVMGRPVEVVARRGVEQSRNARRRQSILDSARPVYVAG